MWTDTRGLSDEELLSEISFYQKTIGRSEFIRDELITVAHQRRISTVLIQKAQDI